MQIFWALVGCMLICACAFLIGVAAAVVHILWSAFGPSLLVAIIVASLATAIFPAKRVSP